MCVKLGLDLSYISGFLTKIGFEPDMFYPSDDICRGPKAKNNIITRLAWWFKLNSNSTKNVQIDLKSGLASHTKYILP